MDIDPSATGLGRATLISSKALEETEREREIDRPRAMDLRVNWTVIIHESTTAS